ncbi:MAG: aminoglycoside 6-adenylyltransferase [Ginsengibacter sp.]
MIIEFTRQYVRVRLRAVLLNGSRANLKVQPDRLQDFGIVFIVDNLESFTIDHSWMKIYLMLFKDKNRTDLTLFPKQKVITNFKPDNLTTLWLDKDDLFNSLS